MEGHHGGPDISAPAQNTGHLSAGNGANGVWYYRRWGRRTGVLSLLVPGKGLCKIHWTERPFRGVAESRRRLAQGDVRHHKQAVVEILLVELGPIVVQQRFPLAMPFLTLLRGKASEVGAVIDLRLRQWGMSHAVTSLAEVADKFV